MSTLETLKAGDKVLTMWGWQSVKVMTVDKVTKIHAIVGGSKYRLRDGWLVGGGAWSRDYIKPYDEQKWRAYKQDQADKAVRRALSDFNWEDLDIETAYKIYAILPAKLAPIEEGTK